MSQSLHSLLKDVRSCIHCACLLPMGPRATLRATSSARLMIVGQAPGRRAHETGIPWNDPSGDRLRDWMRLDRERFYNERQIAIVPAGFYYPGTGSAGDLPPRPECAPKWHPRLEPMLPKLQIAPLVGRYAQAYYLGRTRRATLTETVRAWRDYLPHFLPIPHPGPRNQM